MIVDKPHDFYMKKAIQQAELAAADGEIPVGAIVVCRGRIIAKTYNQTQRLNDVTAHAEMLAITSAAAHLGGKYLNECTMYITLEPCVMCAGALGWSQLGELVIGAADEKKGYSKTGSGILHPKTKVTTGIMAAECNAVLLEFFKNLRY